MGKYEILHTRLGEMLELIDCAAIANGAEPKQGTAAMRYEDAIRVR